MIDEIIQKGIKEICSNVNSEHHYFKTKNVLVVGGAGFLGSWLCDVLISLGSKVVCLDTLGSGNRKNISHLENKKNFRLINVDIINYSTDEKYDFILHMASRAAPDDYKQFPIETLLTNSLGTQNALELSLKSNCRLLYASTSEIYGDSTEVPTSESYWGNVNPVGIRSCYDEGKRFGEALCAAYVREKSAKVKIARIFNTYGPRVRPDGQYGRALSRFVWQALKGDEITIQGTGLQTRSFTYVTDTITAVILLLLEESHDFSIVNIGNNKETTILDLAKMILTITGSKSKISFGEKSPDDPFRRCPDLSKTMKILNWKPNVDLEEGLNLTIPWFQRHGSLMYAQ